MAKFSANAKLGKERREQALLELCQAMVMVKKLPEAAKVLGDLLSAQEIEMIAKRLQIAKLLIKKQTYGEIRKELKVSDTTIARVNIWLQQAGEGFRMVMERGLDNKNMKVPAWQPRAPRSELARRFPLYYWPQNLLEDILRMANNRQRNKMLETIATIRSSGKGKREVFRYLEELLRDPQRNPRCPQQITKEVVKTV